MRGKGKVKKILAVLTVLVLAMTTIFANPGDTETHTVVITATVSEVVPSFLLLYNTSYTNAEALNNDGTQNPPVYYGQFKDGAYYELPAAISTGLDLSKEDITAEFYAVIARGARQTADYLLTFEAGEFDTKSNKVDKPTKCTESTLESTIDPALENVISASEISSVDGNSQTAKISLNGSLASAQVNLLRFRATWTKDTTIDTGTYSADVKMIVSSL